MNKLSEQEAQISEAFYMISDTMHELSDSNYNIPVIYTALRDVMANFEAGLIIKDLNGKNDNEIIEWALDQMTNTYKCIVKNEIKSLQIEQERNNNLLKFKSSN
jgi:hypothetical protein